ncbi:MAG TPA: hypothetical protein DEP57_07860 [Selenomonas sp.]|nr:hypothetical protein [Selenomonas sp.]
MKQLFGMIGENIKMPDLLDSYLGYTFFVKGDGVSEPVHVHVAKGHPDNATKFWLTSDSVEIAKDCGTVDKKDMAKVLRYIRKNKERLLALWVMHFKHAELKR